MVLTQQPINSLFMRVIEACTSRFVISVSHPHRGLRPGAAGHLLEFFNVDLSVPIKVEHPKCDFKISLRRRQNLTVKRHESNKTVKK